MSALPPLISGVEYDSDKKVLAVKFQVGSYTYHNVPVDRGSAMVYAFGNRSKEPGGDVECFNKTIEGKYQSTRIGS